MKEYPAYIKCKQCGRELSQDCFRWRYLESGAAYPNSYVCIFCQSQNDKLRDTLGSLYPKPADGKCMICGEIPNKLHLDHDPITKEYRGYLCIRCNTALGGLGDNIEGLQKAINYLEQVKGRHIKTPFWDAA